MKELFALLLLFAALGCVQQQPVTNLTIGGVDYSFSNDVREALKVPVNDRFDIQLLVLSSNEIDIIFDCSVPEELPSFAVAAYNAVTTVQTYLVYAENRFAAFNRYCFMGEKWYDPANITEEIDKPELGTVLWFKGPKTGAAETSVVLKNTTVTISGTSHKDLTLATDAFSLAFLGVARV